MTFLNTETKLDVIIDNVTYPMSDGTVLLENEDGQTLLYYLSDSGFGMPPVMRQTERGPRQHGNTDIGFLLEPRNTSVIFGIKAPNIRRGASLEEAHDKLLRMFRPSINPIKFRFTRSNGTVRQVDGHVASGLAFATTDREVNTWFQRFNVDVIQPDPTFYDPYLEFVEQFTNPGAAYGLFVPLDVPVSVRGGSHSSVVYVDYQGSAPSYPIIELYGPLGSPKIEHSITGSIISFPDTMIEYNNTYYIDLRNGYKRVIDENDVDRTHELSDDSSLDGWTLEVLDYVQSVTLTADYVGSQSEVGSIKWQNRYLGI